MAYTTINKSTDYFNTKLYTGNNSTNALTGVGFQPDFVWLKPRNLADNHRLMNAVSGADKYLISNSNSGEGDPGSNFASFDSDGFTLGGSDGGWNSSSYNYVAWNWKANGAGSSNSDGSVTSTVSANTTAGFSIVKFDPTGAACTIGHGLGVAPKVIIAKVLSRTFSWVWGGDAIGWTKYLELNETQAEATSTARWNDTAPTSTVFSVKNEYNNGDNAIAYCFAEKTGFSKFGSYTGNGSTDGTFVYCGFKPAFLIQKRSDISANWNMYDNKRSSTGGFNVVDDLFYVDGNNAEISYTSVDFLSNGFKFRSADGAINGSGNNIFMAFAEAPLVGSNNVPATAR